MKRLEHRIAILERPKVDPVNETFYGIVCTAAELRGQAKPEKQPNISLTLKQLAGLLPI